jgi:hypothetical protein
MNSNQDVLCVRCGLLIDNILSGGAKVYQERLVCIDCQRYFDPSQLQEILTAKISSIKREILYADCHTHLQAFSMLPKENWNYLYCKACTQNYAGEKVSFLNQTPRKILTFSLETALKENYTKEIKANWTLKLTGSVTEIRECLQEKFFLDFSTPVCLKHFQAAEFYDLNKFSFKCPSCDLTDKSYSFTQYYQYILEQCRNALASAKTGAFTSAIIKQLNSQQPDKNFFYSLKDLNSTKNSSLTKTSICLKCSETFGFGMRYPIQLHENEHHEICYKCYLKYSENFCFLDGEQKVSTIKPPDMTNLSKDENKRCIGLDHTTYFSYYNRKFPYEFCCGANLCSQCKDAVQRNLLTCETCFTERRLEDVKINTPLLEKLKFSELMCSKHEERPAKYFDDTRFIAYCDKCNGFPQGLRRNTNISKFITAVDNQLTQTAPQSSLAYEIAKAPFLFPITTKLRLLRWLSEPTKVEIFRFSRVFPPAYPIFAWKIKPDQYESLSLACPECMLELQGFLIGMGETGYPSVKILANGDLCANVRLRPVIPANHYQEVMLNKPVIISDTPVSFWFQFSDAEYIYHGLPKNRIRDLTFNGHKLVVGADFFANGNNSIGGPILGFVFSSFYVSARENPTLRLILDQ